jgi:hypothetical protein
MSKLNIWKILILALIVPALAVACSSGDDGDSQEVLELPTLAGLPSVTASNTPTITLTLSDTPSPTTTQTPTDTPSPTFTRTFTPTASPTITLTPTNTLTVTPVSTDTPTLTATSELPQINSFTSSAPTVAGGSSVTLVWDSIADTARIEQLNTQGVVQQTFSVTPTGQLPVTVPNSGSQVIYRLTAQRSGQEVSRSVVIQIQITCPSNWFFGTPPPDVGCPSGPAITVTGKFQPFTNGLMINLPVNNISQVYGLINTNTRYMVYTNSWDNVTTYNQPCGNAPAGQTDPQDVFNWAYHNTLGTVGLWCDATGGIGWGTAGADLGRTMVYQTAASGTTLFININGIGTYRFSGGAQTGTWTKIQ